MRTLLTKTALTVGFVLAISITLSCSGDDGGDNNPGTGTPSSNDNGGSSSSGVSSGGGSSSSGVSSGGGSSSSGVSSGGGSSSSGVSSSGGSSSSGVSSGGGSSSSSVGGDIPCPDAETGSDFVTCGGKTYATVEIDGKIWMKQNLNYRTPDGNSRCYPISGSTNESDADEGRCGAYGRLYNWETAIALPGCNTTTCASQITAKHQGVCPAGWHLPSDAEWTALTTFVGTNPGTKLKARSYLWTLDTGTNEFGFSALPGGLGGSSFYNGGISGNWWSSTENNASSAYIRTMNYDNANVDRNNYGKSNLFSVRCVQD